METAVRCSCGAVFSQSESTVTHRYIRSIPECWTCFGAVLAREYENAVLFGGVHQLTVDAYAVQHPVGQPAKSLVSHLVSLRLALHGGDGGPGAIKAFVESRHDFPTLVPPIDLGPLTVADVAAATRPDEHRERVRDWAKQAWAAWGEHHALIATLLRV
ncbi:MAG: DUF5946 family protein [Vulcanimicrobiaceae bacterium]|jgi:hypothetical protein